MVISQGDIWWATLPEPVGSGPGFHRPVVVVQGDTFNRSQIATIVVVPLTSNTRLAALPGNVLLPAGDTGLPKDSVANVTQIIAIDRSLLLDLAGRISQRHLDFLWKGIDVLFDR
jgi:mRNA interferase MazF